MNRLDGPPTGSPARRPDSGVPQPDDSSLVVASGKTLLALVLLIWGLIFVFSPIGDDYVGQSIMHMINLPFHEAGHLIFSSLGDFMRVLGGTLMQVGIPLLCVGTFLRRGDNFGAACALWWVGQNFIDVAPYIYDARAGELMLLGGTTGQEAPDFHDWHNLLERLGCLNWDHALACSAKVTGSVLILLSSLWVGWLLAIIWIKLKKT